MKKYQDKYTLIFYLVTFSIVLLDQLIKFLASRKIPLDRSIPFTEGVFHLTHSRNYGAGFSILQSQTWLFILVALLFIVLIIAGYRKIPRTPHTQLGFSLLLGGTISNLIDRLLFGYVIDYLDFRIFSFSNNIADIAITFGALLIISYFLVKKR